MSYADSLWDGLGPGEVECRALVWRGLDRIAPPAGLDYLLDHGESDSSPFDLVARRERLEDAPDAVMVCRRDPRAIVAHSELDGVAGVAPGNADPHVRAHGVGVLQRVADEVHEHLLQRHALGLERGHVLGHLDTHLSRECQELDHLAYQCASVHQLGRAQYAAGAR